MSIPSFGPSQRLELSSKYMECNSAEGKCDRFCLYDRVDPQINVAEEGQVVLLSNQMKNGVGMDYHKTEVVPDAAGYTVEFDQIRDMIPAERMANLETEIAQYSIGVNQVERGVRSPHISSGYGWDISVASNSGHPVTIRHTGSEKICRSDLIAIRFPTEKDMESQRDVWNAKGGNKGISVCKFATYPVRENHEIIKHNRLVSDLRSLATDLRYGYKCSDSSKYARLLYLEIPALFKLVREVLEGNEEVVQFFGTDHFNEPDFDILADEDYEQFLRKVSLAAVKFSQSLVPPMVFAQCNSFQCVQPHAKSWAVCGDLMNCTFL